MEGKENKTIKYLCLIIIVFLCGCREKHVPKQTSSGNDRIWEIVDVNKHIYYMKPSIAISPIIKTDSTVIHLYNDGTLHSIDTHIRTKKDGWVNDGKKYHFNEISHHIEKCVTYTNNKLDGPTIYYYDNGLVEHIEQYSEGAKCGTWKYFNHQGELIRNVYY